MPGGPARPQTSANHLAYARFGRRRGRRLRAGRRRLIDTLLPSLQVTIPATGIIDISAMVGEAFEYRDVWLEIGFGLGEHLISQARHHPDVLLIGCEPFVNGVSGLLRMIEADGTSNIRLHDDDARILLDVLPEACIGRLFLLFPDPWPKRRHHKRRLVSPANLDTLARVLKDGAEFRFATDHSGYARWTLWHVINHPALEWPAKSPDDWRVRPGDWPATRYEKKALGEGRKSIYLTFQRRVRAA